MMGVLPKASILATGGKYLAVAIVVNRLLASRLRAPTKTFEDRSFRRVVGG